MAAINAAGVQAKATAAAKKKKKQDNDDHNIFDDPNLSLREKLRLHYERGYPRGNTRYVKVIRLLFVTLSVTNLYVTLHYLVPFTFQDFHPMVQYCIKVFFCFIHINVWANWLCVVCYSNEYTPSKDRPDIDVHVFNDNPPDRFGANLSLHQGNGHVTIDVTEKGGLPWRYCKHCDMSIPPRAHHCKVCQKCVLRRDHHCFMVGTCIGHWNQRYFVMWAAFGMPMGYLGAYLTISYLYHHHPEDSTLWDYVMPVAMIKFLLGQVGGLQALLTCHAFFQCVFGPAANMYFLSQLSVIVQGKTLHELAKRKNIRVTASIEDNFRLVFGDYWLLNFLFPAQLLFKQENNGLQYDGVKVGFEPKTEKRECEGKSS